jgi:hypothetical protein
MPRSCHRLERHDCDTTAWPPWCCTANMHPASCLCGVEAQYESVLAGSAYEGATRDDTCSDLTRVLHILMHSIDSMQCLYNTWEAIKDGIVSGKPP